LTEQEGEKDRFLFGRTGRGEGRISLWNKSKGRRTDFSEERIVRGEV